MKPHSLRPQIILSSLTLSLLVGLLFTTYTHAVAKEEAANVVTLVSEDHASSEALKAIQGKWKLVTMRAAGNDAPPQVIETFKYEFKGDKLMITPDNPNANGSFSVKLDPSAKPIATLDMTDLAGKREGRTLLGIYALEQGKLKICFGNKRPSGFIATRETGYGQLLIELVRE